MKEFPKNSVCETLKKGGKIFTYRMAWELFCEKCNLGEVDISQKILSNKDKVVFNCGFCEKPMQMKEIGWTDVTINMRR